MGRTAHRAIDELLAADTLYFGDVEPDAVYLGDTLIYSGLEPSDPLTTVGGDPLTTVGADPLTTAA